MGTQSNDFFKGLMPLDELGYRATIDVVHAKIHDGDHYTSMYYKKLVGAGSALNILITAPSTDTYHVRAEFGVDGPGIFTLSRTPGFDATGASAITSYNNDENSANVSTLTHQAGGVYTSDGTVLNTYVIGASRLAAGGDGAEHVEWILAPNSIHLLRWVADAASCRTVIRTQYYKE